MRRAVLLFASSWFLLAGLTAHTAPGRAGSPAAPFTTGRPAIESMSSLAFGPDGVLFIGDGKGGAVWAVDLGKPSPRESTDPLSIDNIEQQIASLLGTSAEQVMIHDMAVNPVSQDAYLAVSRGRSKWETAWLLPNDIADASVLLRVSPDKSITEVSLDDVPHARAALPNPVEASKKHRWKDGISLRADTITDMAFARGTLYVAGLSNEEFASTMWTLSYPFGEEVAATTLEIFHGAHGAYETHAPIRAFLPYAFADEVHLIASYLCTPLVDFKATDLVDGKHLKGRTVAEFGSGNYPLDMIAYEKDGKHRLLIANSNLPLMIVRPEDVAAFQGEIAEEVDGYTAGVPYEIRSGAGIQQIDNLNGQYVLALQRLPGGTMNMVSLPLRRF